MVRGDCHCQNNEQSIAAGLLHQQIFGYPIPFSTLVMSYIRLLGTPKSKGRVYIYMCVCVNRRERNNSLCKEKLGE